MRSLEILLLIVNLPIALRFLLYRRTFPFWFDAVPLISFLVLMVHAGSEGARWSMGPAYLTTVLLFLSSMVPIARSAPLPNPVRALLGSGSCICLLLAFVLSTALPVFGIPLSTGDFRVGTTTHILARASGHPIKLRIWYPIDEGGGTTSYLFGESKAFSKVVGERLGIPAFLLEHFDLVTTESRVDAELSDVLPRYPVVVHSHDGVLGFPEMHSALLRDLASRGYLVVGINHTGLSTYAVLDQAIVSAEDEQDEHAATTMAADAERVLDWLESLSPANAHGWLADRVDLGRVAYVGHGTGGEAAYDACSQSTSFYAGISIGANLVGRRPLPSRPFMFFNGEGPVGASAEDFFGEMGVDGYVVRVADSGAYSFTDVPLWSPLIPTRLDVGPIEPRRAHFIVSTYVHAFLNASLNRGVIEPLLDGASPEFPDVSIAIHAGDE